MELKVTPWANGNSPTPDLIQATIHSLNLRGYTWSNDAYDRYAAHSHTFDKVLYVLSGSITWILPQTNQELTTQAGDRIDLPRGTLHAARVGAQGVTCFEAHLDSSLLNRILSDE